MKADENMEKTENLLELKSLTSMNTRHDTMSLFPILTDGELSYNTEMKLYPSTFLREMQLTTEARLQKLKKSNALHQPSFFFSITPSTLIFQSYDPGKTYRIPFSVRNCTQVLRSLSLQYEPSPYFSISYLNKVYSKVAPGMSIQFVAQFVPTHYKDYFHSINFLTRGEMFTVPVIALGPRPLLDFPDSIFLERAMVKIPHTQNIVVYNIGQIPATFNLITESPFSITPEKTVLNTGERAELKLTLLTFKEADGTGKLTVKYENGEVLTIDLFYSAKSANIQLDCSSVCFPDTFMGLKRFAEVTLVNNSDHIVNYFWHEFPNLQADICEIEKMKDSFEAVQYLETHRCGILNYNDVITKDENERVYTRIYTDQVASLGLKDFPFLHKDFSITPSSGEIWPNCSINFAVVFSPTTIAMSSAIAYCDIEGREQRIPLEMSGYGLGPNIQLSLDCFDADNIFLCSTCTFEVIVKNEGDIPGHILFQDNNTMFKGKVTCNPGKHFLLPHHFGTFIVSFSSNRVGVFVEDICFQIEESSQIVKLLFTGTVINPILSFSTLDVDFGLVSVGFPKVKSVNLLNKSSVPIRFFLHVPNDGKEKAITIETFAQVTLKPALPSYPKEFSVEPSAGVLEAHSSVKIKVTLVTNTERKYKTPLVAENQENSTEPVALQMIYKSTVANITCEPKLINIHFCFINFPTVQVLKICNTSQVPGYFVLPDLMFKNQDISAVATNINEGRINPMETKEITLSVTAFANGTHTIELKMLVFGKSYLIPICSITCTGQGPVVSYKEKNISFGKVTLLQPKSMSIAFINNSPIPANFKAEIVNRRKAKWELEPSSGLIEPEKYVELTVTLTLVDPGKFTATLLLNVKHSRIIKIVMTASGTGSSIVFEPNIFPELDLGFLFTHKLNQIPLKISNPGTRLHLLQFVPNKISLKLNTDEESEQSYFKCSPIKLQLGGGEESTIFLEAKCSSVCEVVEQFTCFATIEKRGLRETLGTCLLKANFIIPDIEISAWKLDFDINVGPEASQDQSDSKIVTIVNTSQLPVTVKLCAEPPFNLLENDQSMHSEKIIVIPSHEEALCNIVFIPGVHWDLNSVVFNSVVKLSYLEHPQVDKIQLVGRLNFPNISLSSDRLDFGSIPLSFEAHRDVIMRNTSPLPVSFHWTWDEDSFVINKEKLEDFKKMSSVIYNQKRSVRSDIFYQLPDIPFRYNEFKNEEIILNNIRKFHSQTESIANDEISEKRMHDKLFPIISSHFVPQSLMPELDILPKQSTPVNLVSQFLDISPMRGCIPPHQAVVLSVAFRPDPFITLASKAYCCILGGPTQTLYFSGQSSSLDIIVSNTRIDYGFKPFTRVCEESITINNSGHLDCNYTIKICSETKKPGRVHSGKLEIEPTSGKISSDYTTILAVRYYPGYVGEINEKFNLQIEYLKPIEISVHGYLVFPQVFVNMPEVPRPNYPIHYMYSAIASLTAERFENALKRASMIPEDVVDYEDWYCISTLDEYPSNISISLAIERIIFINLRKQYPHLVDHPSKKPRPIPMFFVPGYFIDFGSIIIGTEFEYSTTIDNRGLLRADVSLHFMGLEKKLKKDGIYIEFQNTVNLPLRRSIPLRVVLRPTINRYPKEESMDICLQLQVNEGATIPIKMRALFTFPNLVVNCTSVNFGNVSCGHCKIMFILLKNVGLVTCEWSVSLRVIKRKEQISSHSSKDDNPFSVDISSGIYPPKTAGFLSIFFQPRCDKIYEVLLKLRMRHNPNTLVISLHGIGVEPKVILSEEFFNFGSYLPNSEPVEKIFTIMNPCPFNVEFYFLDDEKIIEEEDRVLRVLTHLYRANSLLLPINLYDIKMTSELQAFYYKLVDEVRTSLVTTGTSAARYASLDNSEKSSRDRRSQWSGPVVPQPLMIEDPLKSFTKAEMEELVHKYIDRKYGSTSTDPLLLKESTIPKPVVKSDTDDHGLKSGILIIFHGAPFTDHIYWANRTARNLGLSVVNIDQIILEEAITSLNMCALQIRDTINSAFVEKFEGTEILTNNVEDREDEPIMELTLEDLTKRVNLLDLYKEQNFPKTNHPSSASSKYGTKSSKKSKPQTKSGKSSKFSKVDVENTFCSIPIETISELIGPRILAEATNPGLVVETLTGIFVRNVALALNMLVNIVKNIRYIHFVSLSYSLEMYEKWQQDLKEQREKELFEIQQKRLADMMSMSGEEMDQLTTEDFKLFNKFVTPHRKSLHQKKLENIACKKNLLYLKQSEPKHMQDKLKIKKKDKDELLLELSSRDASKKSKPSKKAKSEQYFTPKVSSKSKSKDKNSEKPATTNSSLQSKSKERENITRSTPSTGRKGKSSRKSNKGQYDESIEETLRKQELASKFTKYQNELSQVTPILREWNRILCHPVNVSYSENLSKVKKSASQKHVKSKGQNKSTTPTVTSEKISIVTDKSPVVGIPCWILNLPETPNLFWFNGVIENWSRLRLLREARVKKTEWDDILNPENLLLACINKPEGRELTICSPSFQIYDVDDEVFSGLSTDSPLPGSEQGSSEIFSTRQSFKSKKKRKNKKSLISAESVSLSEEQSPADLHKQFILSPGEEIKRKVCFIPYEEGEFNEKIVLEIAGWRTHQTITCMGSCDIPRIDTNPRVMFTQVEDELNTSKINHCVYLLNEELFYFGPVLVAKSEEKNTHNSVANFNFSNISKITAEVSFKFISNEDANQVEGFGFTPETLIIEPGECKQLEVYACPTSYGKTEETLVYNIKHNSATGYIKMTSIGIKPEMNFDPKSLSFNRVLMYRKEVRTLQLKNQCYEPLGWKLVWHEDLGQQVSISETSGIVLPMSSYDVYVYFTASVVELFKKIITIEIYDDKFRGLPLFSESLLITAECVDVLVDIIFPTQKCTYLNFKKVKVGEPQLQNFYLKNRGKYDVTFQIKFHENSDELQFDPQEIFFIQPTSGTLKNTGKNAVISVTCHCRSPLNITNIPTFQVWIIDTGPKAVPVAKIPISVSVISFSSKYKISPIPDIHFGAMVPGTKKTETLKIDNIGTFAFTYKILSRHQADLEDKTLQQKLSSARNIHSPASGKSSRVKLISKLSSRGKFKSKGPQPTSLVLGVFTVTQILGVLEPSESANIDINCLIEDAGSYKEEIVIRVSECVAKDMKGQSVMLNAFGFFPKLDFGNTDFIFHDAIPESSQEKITGEPVVVYNKEEECLKFQNMCVGTEEALSIGLHFHNCEHVPCPVIATLVSGNDNFAYTISPKIFTISSLLTESISVSFKPPYIGCFEDVLKITVDIPAQSGPQTFLTKLIGQGSYPQVEVIKPPQYTNSCNQPELTITFPPTETGLFSIKEFAIQNVHTIICKVMIQLMDNDKRLFSITPTESTIPNIKFYNPKEEIQSLTITNIKPDQICDFLVKFSPKTTGDESCKIKIFIARNPFEDQIINVSGIGYKTDIIFKNIECAVENEESNRSPVLYLLNFEPCIVGTEQEKVFLVVNDSEFSVYRFEFEEQNNISFKPQVGHLPPGSEKYIVAKFTSSPPQTVLDKEAIKCTICQLSSNDGLTLRDWDDTCVTIHWVENEETDEKGSASLEKTWIRPGEPDCNMVPGTESFVTVLVTANAHSPKITCSTTNIEFVPTFVFNEVMNKFTLHNSGLMNVRYRWILSKTTTKAVDNFIIISQCNGVSMSNIKPNLVPVTSMPRNYLHPSISHTQTHLDLSKVLNTKYHQKPRQIPSSALLLKEEQYKHTAAVFDLSNVMDEQKWPICFSPESGEIPSNGSVTMTVTFLPLILRKYSCELLLKIDNYEELENIKVSIKGSSLMPCIHLVVEPESKIDHPFTIKDLIIEFSMVGVGIVKSKDVLMMNPTTTGYKFQWSEIHPPSTKAISPFHCSNLYGYIEARHEKIVTFSFLPDSASTFESTWLLQIPDRLIKQTITLRGIATEPSVKLLSSHMQLNPTLLGLLTSKETQLFNYEQEEFKFKIDDSSLYSEARSNNIVIDPMEGIIDSNSEVRLRVSYIPKTSGDFQFNVKIHIQKRERPLMMEVKTICYLVQPLLYHEKFDKSKTNISCDVPAEIDLGSIVYRFPENVVFHLTNIGKASFFFSLHWNNEQLENSFLNIVCNEMSGRVTPQSRSVITLKVTPLRRMAFKNIKVEILISKGPTYVILLSGTSAAHLFEFSFQTYDFGLCFVQTSNDVIYEKILYVRNIDEQPLLLETQFEDTANVIVHLHESIVAPRAQVEIPIVFQARACQKYTEIIPFLINGTYTYNITIKAEGTLMQVGLVKPAHKLIDLGSVLVGKCIQREIAVVNKSRKPVNAKFTTVFQTNLENADVCPLTLEPKDVLIKPSQTKTLTIKFAPKELINNILVHIIMECDHFKECLSIIKCKSIGAAIALDRDVLVFGNVIVGNSCVNRFLLSNKGDVLIKFRWVLEGSKAFTISPSEGHSAPGCSIIHEVKFSPIVLDTGFRCLAICVLEGFSELNLTLSGRSVELEPPVETLYFSCEVRQSAESTISCHPKFGQNTVIIPVISGEYFCGPQSLNIQVFSPLVYPVTYYPLSMNPVDGCHEGSVVFPFPDGSCIHYALRGETKPPKAEDKITREVTTHFVDKIKLPVINWLNINQRFSVKYESLNDVKSKTAYKFTGNYFIEVPGNQERQFLLTFLAYFPGTVSYKVVFINELTQEYLWYQLEYNVKQCAKFSEINLTTRIREPVTHVLPFENTFAEPLYLTFSSTVREVTALNLPCAIQPGEHKGVLLQYLPLHRTSFCEEEIRLCSEECGVFPYAAFLIAMPPLPEPAVSLECELGWQKHGTVVIENKSDVVATFSPVNTHPNFVATRPVTAKPGEFATIEVIYEPSSFINTHFDLEIESEEAGFFVVPLIGICIKPRPRGPFIVKAGSSVTVTLSNVFNETKAFCWYTDNPAFVVDTSTAIVEPKQVLKINITMFATRELLEMKEEWRHIPVTGKLVVSISDPALSHLKWAFYIKGYVQE